MKIAVISDIHQTVFWKNIINQINDFDKIIFLGDEFDCWDNQWPLQIKNAQEIVEFKKSCPEKIDLCWSNHATSYFLDERCSGYQSEYAAEIKNFFNNNKDLYNPVYIYDNWIFSHAGVSAKWMKYCRISELREINQLFREKPNVFKWMGPEGSGNNAAEGPLWIRPEALINNYVHNFNQIAGHTEDIKPRIIKKHWRIFVFCDTHEHNYLTVMETKKNEVNFIYWE